MESPSARTAFASSLRVAEGASGALENLGEVGRGSAPGSLAGMRLRWRRVSGFSGAGRAPQLQTRHVVLRESLAAREGRVVRQLIQAGSSQGHAGLPYSPDFKPIEQARSKIKSPLRMVKARVVEGPKQQPPKPSQR